MPESAEKLTWMGFHQDADTVEAFMFDVGNYRAFPKAHGKRIRTTNMVERVNGELKRRTKGVAVFPSWESLLRLAGSILMDINEEWIMGSRYLGMTEFHDKQILEDESGLQLSSECQVASIVDH